MSEQVRQSVMSGNTWIRGLYMILFAVIYQLAELVLVFVCFLQFLFKLLTGELNEPLLDFGDDVTAYIQQILQFETFNSEYRPFPFNPWPGQEGMDQEVTESEVVQAERED